MKSPTISLAFVLIILGSATGCNPGQDERDRRRLESEEQAQRDLKRSNDAVNEVSKKLGRKAPTMDIGVPIEKVPPPASPAEAKK